MKYYQPKIKEFHVGFECEWQSKIRNETWNKQICDVDLINIAYDAIEHTDEEEPYEEQFRVKYLDEQDILDLGFIKKSFNYNNFLESFCEVYENIDLNIVIGHYININKISVITRDTLSSKNEAVKRGYLENPTANLIIIKNKNEFKKLLTQLEITI